MTKSTSDCRLLSKFSLSATFYFKLTLWLLSARYAIGRSPTLRRNIAPTDMAFVSRVPSNYGFSSGGPQCGDRSRRSQTWTVR